MDRKYLIIGTGALGTVFGGLLQNTGRDVTFLGMGEHYNKIVKNGIKIEGIWGNYKISPIKAHYDHKDIKEKFDIILICVKSNDTASAALIAKDLLKSDGICVSLQNGLGNVEKISEIIGVNRTVGGRVIFGVEINKPGIAKVSVYADKVLIGEPFGKVNEYNLIGLESALDEAKIPTSITDNILGYIWAKTLYNCALNPLSAILKVTYGELAENPDTSFIMENIIKEIYAVANKKEIKMLLDKPEDYIDLFFNKLIPPTKAHHSSMYQDLNAGRITEIDALNNAIVNYGKELNIETPYNETITRLIKFHESKLTS